MENNSSSITSFDSLTFSNRLQMLKVLFPYLPPASRKFVSSYIKVNELNNAFNLCGKGQEAVLSACAEDGGNKSPLEMLGEIKNFCNKAERENIDMALNFFSAFQMYRNFMENEKGDSENNNSSFFDKVKNMLTPEQQSMFENYQTMFNSAENG